MKEWFRDNAVWYLKQLLPFKYHREYTDYGKTYVCTWRVWLGMCFGVKSIEVVLKSEHKE